MLQGKKFLTSYSSSRNSPNNEAQRRAHGGRAFGVRGNNPQSSTAGRRRDYFRGTVPASGDGPVDQLAPGRPLPVALPLQILSNQNESTPKKIIGHEIKKGMQPAPSTEAIPGMIIASNSEERGTFGSRRVISANNSGEQHSSWTSRPPLAKPRGSLDITGGS